VLADRTLPNDLPYCAAVGFCVLDRLLGVARASDAVVYSCPMLPPDKVRALLDLGCMPVVLTAGETPNDHPIYDFALNIDAIRLLPGDQLLDGDDMPVRSPPTVRSIAPIRTVFQAARIVATHSLYPEIRIPLEYRSLADQILMAADPVVRVEAQSYWL
jgi:hypothetical protein